MRVAFGVVQVVIPSFFILPHLKILYILFTSKTFRTPSYRILAQIQLVTVILLPYYVLLGCSAIFHNELYGITVIFANLADICITFLMVMDMVLALSRLKVMLELHYPASLDKSLQAFVWLGSLVLLCLIMSPMAGYKLADDLSIVAPNIVLPWEKFRLSFETNLGMFCSATTFVFYLILVAYLVYKKCKTTNVALHVREKPILLQALVRFLGDLTLQVAFKIKIYIVPTEDGEEVMKVLSHVTDMVSMINYICLPVCAFLVLNTSIRQAMAVPTRVSFLKRNTNSTNPIT